jgi:uncharacterized protein
MILPSPASYRVPGYDLARALAVLGMVVVNYTSMLEVSRFSPAWLEPVIDFFYGRAAVVFVMLAGVSVSLMARRRPAPADLRTLRRRLMKRSLLLLIAGMALWPWWSADILHFYAVFIAAGAWAVTWNPVRLQRCTAAILLVSLPVCAALTASNDFSDAVLMTDGAFDATGLLLDYLISPYYSVFPWLGFFFAGMLLGRREPADASFWWRTCFIGALGCLSVELLYGAATAWARQLDWQFEGIWWEAFLRSEAFPATPLFVLSSAFSGLALIAVCRAITCESRQIFAPVHALAACGRLSLTLYVAHIGWGIMLKRWFGGADAEFTCQQMFLAAGAFGVFSLFFAAAWFRRFQRGPLEALFHWLTHGRRSNLKGMNSGPGATAVGAP